ncbi:MAG: hypothetical protein K0R65_2251 [Crocinitomicaceae bacterium]|jgi:hypothetical protein|nr:hypothetical protein [Crocinitomicaceae bacterium]
MLDFDLAELYEVQTKNLNLAVKRNIKRFPPDFMFQLTTYEWQELRFKVENSDALRLQIETLKKGRGQHSKYLPYAFTEQGLAMLSGVLNSDKAIEANIAIMRTFVFMRQFALTHLELTEKLKELETNSTKQFADIYEALNYLLQKEKQAEQQTERKQIGFKN